VAVSVAPLRWSSSLASAAARTRVREHERQPQSLNLWWAIYRGRPTEVVASWVDEANNSCVVEKQCST
jgi:hypothetical protein